MTKKNDSESTAKKLASLLGSDAYKLTPATLANKVSHGDWLPAKHLMYLSSIIAKKVEKGGARLIISMPFRHGKSELTSIWTPVWALNNHPEWEIMLTSYGKDLATDFGRKVRDIIALDGDEIEGEGLLNVKINPNSTNVGRWHTSKGGSMKSIGLGGPVNGRGADLFLVDDYFKNPEEAMSQTTRNAIFDWFSAISLSRLSPNASIIVIATRWHKDDLSGRLLSLPDSDWEEVRLPIYAEENDPLGRDVGELLWKERYGEKQINELKKTMSSFIFSAVMMQNPKSSSSDSFKIDWIKKISSNVIDMDSIEFIRSWDLAGTEGDGDWTVGTLMSRNRLTDNVIIHDVIRVQKSPGGVQKIIEDTMVRDGIGVKVVMEQEPGSSGKAVADGFIRRNPSFFVIAKKSSGNKFTRLQPFFAACEHGRVSMVNSPWNDTLLDELISIPDGKHDDIGDTLSQGYNHFFAKRATAGAFGRKVNYGIGNGNLITGVVF